MYDLSWGGLGQEVSQESVGFNSAQMSRCGDSHRVRDTLINRVCVLLLFIVLNALAAFVVLKILEMVVKLRPDVDVRPLFPCLCAGHWSLRCAECNFIYDFRFQTTCEGAREGWRGGGEGGGVLGRQRLKETERTC